MHFLGVATNPDGPWVTQVARSFCTHLEDAGRRLCFLIRDRDTKFTVRAPNANASAERWVRTVREHCLDHLLVVSRRHLKRALAEYVAHYNQARPHRSLNLTPPRQRPTTQPEGVVRRRDLLGELIHEYDLAA